MLSPVSSLNIAVFQPRRLVNVLVYERHGHIEHVRISYVRRSGRRVNYDGVLLHIVLSRTPMLPG